jgi:hypothetical protein
LEFLLLLLSVFPGCPKKNEAPPVPSASASASAAPVVDSGPTKNEWTGNYDSQPGTLTVPDGAEWKGVKFRGDDAGDGLGKGTLHLLIDPDGRASGDGDGPFGPFTLTGALDKDVVTFTILRKDPTDMGFTGTGRGTIAADKLDGTIRASKATGNVIREATFSLHR